MQCWTELRAKEQDCVFALICAYKYSLLLVNFVIFFCSECFQFGCSIVLEFGQNVGIYNVLSLCTGFSSKAGFRSSLLQFTFTSVTMPVCRNRNGSKLIPFWPSFTASLLPGSCNLAEEDFQVGSSGTVTRTQWEGRSARDGFMEEALSFSSNCQTGDLSRVAFYKRIKHGKKMSWN